MNLHCMVAWLVILQDMVVEVVVSSVLHILSKQKELLVILGLGIWVVQLWGVGGCGGFYGA